MSAKTYIPQKWCSLQGGHFYAALFQSCPIHRVKLPTWNVRVRTKYYTIKKPDGSMTNDQTFQQKALTGKEAGRIVCDAVFGGREAAELHVRGIEVWPATATGEMNDAADPKRQWEGKAE